MELLFSLRKTSPADLQNRPGASHICLAGVLRVGSIE
jgi:hypothetical protein